MIFIRHSSFVILNINHGLFSFTGGAEDAEKRVLDAGLLLSAIREEKLDIFAQAPDLGRRHPGI
jgi:hypothetical protein